LNEQTGKYETKLSLKGLDIVNDFMEEELPRLIFFFLFSI